LQKQVCARLNQIGEDRLLWKYLVLTTFPYAFAAKPEKDNWKALFIKIISKPFFSNSNNLTISWQKTRTTVRYVVESMTCEYVQLAKQSTIVAAITRFKYYNSILLWI